MDGLWYWDLENPENEWMNARFWTILGYNPDEMPHKSSAWQHIINQDDLKIATDNFLKHCDNPTHPYDQLVRYTHKNGSIVWIRCRGLAIRNELGKPIRMLGAHQDVSHIKNSEQELLKAIASAKENEEKYRAMYNNAPLSYQSLDENGCFIDINPMWLKTLGYERSEVIGKWYGDFLHPDYVEHFRINFPAFKKRGYVSDVQFKLRRKDGTYIYVSFEGCIGYTPEGKFRQTYCVFKDISEQKALENALIRAKEKAEESEEKFRKSIEFSPIPMAVANINGDLLFLNNQFIETFGYTKEELVSIPKWFELVYPDMEYRNSLITQWNRDAEFAIKNNIPTPARECFVTCKNGNIKTIENTVFITNEISIGLFLDVTERKKSMAVLQQIEWMLSKKAKSENFTPKYGDLSELNKNGLILTLVGNEQLIQIASEYLDLLETSTAIYEKNGDYAMGLFSSSWCQMMDTASYKLCNTDNHEEALNCGKWLCHESCWQDASLKAIESGKPEDVECKGGIRLFAVPIYVNGKVIGAINFGYGEPPKTDVKLQELSALYQVSIEELKKASQEYQIRPQYIIDYAKKRIQVSAQYLGNLIERKQFELELSESAERFKALHNASFGGIAIHDKGIILECNQGLSEMTGYSLEELIGMDGLLLIAPEQRELVMNNIVSGFEKPYEAFGLRKNGEQFPIRLEARNIPYKGKNVRTVEFRDITENKKAEEALRKSEAKLSALFISMSEMVVLHELVFDGDGKPVNYRITDCNEAFTKITGITRDASLGKLATEVYDTMEPPYFKEFSEVAFTGKPYHYETYFEPMDKHFSISVICPEKNHFATVTTDITERRHAELLIQEKSEEIAAQNEEMAAQNEELIQTNQELIEAKEKAEENEKKYRELFEANKDGITIFHILPDGKLSNFLEMNEAAGAMIGYSKLELSNMKASDLEIDNSDEKIKNRINELQLKGFSNFETIIKHKNGNNVPVEVNVLMINYQNRPALMNITRDISEHKLAEQEIIKAKEKAEESDRLKSAFLANMSHEIRTPMNGILGFADLLKAPELSGEEQQAYIKIIEKSGARMLNIINDIIDISKIEAGLMKLDSKESNINEQIEYIYTFFKPEAEAKKLKISFNNALPAKEAVVTTDREKLYAILTNLVKNAIKYTHNGSIEFGYNLKTDNETNELEFYVKDTGIGIPKERHEAIFERFIQADISDKMAYQGAGLGLAISKAYVEMLGGKIRVECEEGEGSCFYFTLPYKTEFVLEKIDLELSPLATNEKVKNLKILIAEDDEVSEMLIDNLVKSFGKEILKVRTGVEAIEICRNNPDIDLIMMDILMPEMGGYDATRKIREFNKTVVIIAQTAYALAGDRENAIASGCNDYISKPINKKELLALMQKYFEK